MQQSEKQPNRGLTKQFAQIFGVKENTVRYSLCVKGHYAGLVPVKAGNRFLYWDLDKARAIVSGATATSKTEVEGV